MQRPELWMCGLCVFNFFFNLIEKSGGLYQVKKFVFSTVMAFVAGICAASVAQAGPGKVEVQTLGDITLRMGAQVRLIPTSESSRDFGVSSELSSAQEAKAAASMRALGVGSDSTKVHLTEAGGAVKDNYIRGENRLFFNFSQDQNWDVYFALESDTTLDRTSADRTDFAFGRQSQQFGIERLEASFNVPWISSRITGGWDVKGADVKFGGLVYGDDDPHIGIEGCADNFTWGAYYTKKDESEAGYYADPSPLAINPIGSPTQKKDTDRTFYWGKLGYNMKEINTFVEGFYFLDVNEIGGKEADRHFTGINVKGDYGIFKPMAEVVYNFGKYDSPGNARDYNIQSWAMFADLAVDLKDMMGIKQFMPHFGGYYLQGDDDTSDYTLSGFAPAVGIQRFTPRYGSEQSISLDGNPIFGQILYSMFPAYYGTVRGGGINGAAALDNPGFSMIGGGLKAAVDNFKFNVHVMAMWFNETEPVETYYLGQGLTGNVDVDEFMGVEWNNEVIYQVFKSVSIKGGAAFLFPGSGAKDITRALNAIGRGVNFEDGKESDDVSMRFAMELLWFF